MEIDISFDIDEDVILRADFTDADEQPADPEELDATAVKPDGTVVPVTMSTVDTGIFEGTTSVDQPGRWWWRVAFTGDRRQVEESPFFVRTRRVPAEGS